MSWQMVGWSWWPWGGSPIAGAGTRPILPPDRRRRNPGLPPRTAGSMRHDEPVELVTLVGDLPHRQLLRVDVYDRQRVDVGDEPGGELLPGGGVDVLLGVVQAGAAGAGDQVDHA